MWLIKLYLWWLDSHGKLLKLLEVLEVLICGIAVRPGLITLTPAMQGSIMSATAARVNGAGENITRIGSLTARTPHFFFFSICYTCKLYQVYGIPFLFICRRSFWRSAAHMSSAKYADISLRTLPMTYAMISFLWRGVAMVRVCDLQGHSQLCYLCVTILGKLFTQSLGHKAVPAKRKRVAILCIEEG